MSKLPFHKFPSIEQFKSAVYRANKNEVPSMRFKSKVKTNGTNAAIYISNDGGVHIHKRGSAIPLVNDNRSEHYGFSGWVQDNVVPYVKNCLPGSIVLHGEWAGGNIQKSVASSQARKFFTVFAIDVQPLGTGEFFTDFEPDYIEGVIRNFINEGGQKILVTPWYDEIEVSFTDQLKMNETVAHLNSVIDKVEAEDPYMKDVFGIEGIGEGLVYYQDPDTYPELMTHTLDRVMMYAFKAKGEKHSTSRTKSGKSVEIDPVVIKKTSEFTHLVITESRVLQSIHEVGGEPSIRKKREYLQWIWGDVQKENQEEILASGMEWKDLQQAISKSAASLLRSQF